MTGEKNSGFHARLFLDFVVLQSSIALGLMLSPRRARPKPQQRPQALADLDNMAAEP